jgi:hypothetical protein
MLVFLDEMHGEFARDLDAVQRMLRDDVAAAAGLLLDRRIYAIDFGPSNIGLIDGRGVVFDLSNASVENPKIQVL